MGMDVYGRNPSEDAGTYFRSSIWYWPSILSVIASTKVLDDDTIIAMSYNDGAGPGALDAERLADALDALVEGMSDDTILPTGGKYDNTGTAGFANILRQLLPMNDAESEVHITVGDIRQFAEFSRYSGGFSVC